MTAFFRTALLTMTLANLSSATEPLIILPTANDAIYRGDNPDFYMYVNRNWEGVETKPWEGGQYGMVRGPRMWGASMVMGQWHEGIDIKPMERDANGEPLDEVHAIAGGRVVHASKVARDSNYGCYVVIEHTWEGCPYYSLYAHLRAVGVEAGETVRQGATIGKLGYTGDGIDRERAHVHLEIGVILNDHFDLWYQLNAPTDPNKHGNWNGMNLVGIDTANFYLQLKSNPALTLSQFIQNQEPYYAIAFPAGPHFDIVSRYPWLTGGTKRASAWLFKFTQGGVPIRAEPYSGALSEPKVVYLKKETLPGTITSKNYITLNGESKSLTGSGQKFISLLSGDFKEIKE